MTPFTTPHLYKGKTEKWIIVMCAGMLLLLLALRISIVFSYVAEITGVDNNFVYTTLRMLAGLSPYSDPEKFPYLGNIYAPLYFQVNFLAGKLTGVSPEDPIKVFRLCRTMSLLQDIAGCYLFYRIAARYWRGVPVWIATTFFALILCFLPYTFSRVDSLFLLLYIWVFYQLSRPGAPSARRIAGIAFLSTCAVFAKQNGIVLLLLIPIWLILSHQLRRVPLFLAAYGVFVLIFIVLNAYILGYTHLFDFMIKGVRNQIDGRWFYQYIFKPIAGSLLLVPLAVGAYIGFYGLIGKGPTRPIAAVFLLQLLFSTGSAFKWGSSLGYYYENFFLCLLLMQPAPTSEPAPTQEHGATPFRLAVPVLLIFFVHVMAQDFLFFVSQQGAKKSVYTVQKTVSDWLGQQGSNHVLDVSNPNRNFFKHFLYRRLAVPHFDTIDCCLLPDGNFNYDNLKQELRNGSISHIIFWRGSSANSLWGLSLASYRKDTTIDNYDIYRYAPSQ